MDNFVHNYRNKATTSLRYFRFKMNACFNCSLTIMQLGDLKKPPNTILSLLSYNKNKPLLSGFTFSNFQHKKPAG